MPIDRPPDVPDNDPPPADTSPASGDTSPAPADRNQASRDSSPPHPDSSPVSQDSTAHRVDAQRSADDLPPPENPAQNADAPAADSQQERPSSQERFPAEERTRQEYASTLRENPPIDAEPAETGDSQHPPAERESPAADDSPESGAGTDTNTPTDRETTHPPTPETEDRPETEDTPGQPSLANPDPTEELPPENPDTPTPDPAPPDHPTPQPDTPHPLTDQQWSEHVTEVVEGLVAAREAGLRTDRLHTIDKGREIWREDRELLHDSLIQDLYSAAASVPCDHKAVIAGGLGGAGKTTILTQHARIDLSQFLMINPDTVKEEMARRSMIPEIEGLSPMEASDLAHEESSYVARQLALLAQSDGKNLIWDITMSKEDSTKERIKSLREDGYSEISAVFVDIPIETSVKRTESRHRQGHDEWLDGDGLGGRYVPPEVVRSQADEDWGSKNRKTFEAVKEGLDSWVLYDNSINGRPPVLIDTSNRTADN
jgi:predicted ABC-type ATPase